ncbi:MAG: gliding motility-associated C-terminal domain-containing protein [Burkholderiales bacterium]|nr:gliding motility-associated C-terminal domain-containing protein [Bacteroidia bacterium]
MKKLTLLFSLLALFQQLTSQTFWAYTAGSIKEDEAMDICYDNSGNIISAGYFSGTTGFAPGYTLNPVSIGNPDIYISKSTAAGQIIWAAKAGGNGSDRATSVKADASGNIYITGYYYGSATFGSTILTSISGSQDGFIAKLDPSGNFLWAKSFGGNLAEWGNAIAIDELDNPIITGQFQGASNFSGTTLTSMINPNTLFSSFDVFVAKYSPAGNLIWVNQGKAKYDDRGLDIITDNLNNIYVCGQFSDTVQFQNTHNNMIMNATFIIKYNASGQEQWFRKAAGVFSIAYSMIMDNANKIYVTGDFQGTLTYFGASGNSFVNGAYTNKAFLLKIDNNGTFIWGKSESSTNYVSSKRVALDTQQDPYVFGEFACTMNEYSDAYGPGVFNSIGFGDLFITKYNTTGTRQWFKHYGGPRNDKAHGLLVAGINEPIMAGSYEQKLNIPNTYTNNMYVLNSAFTVGLYIPQQPDTYCSAPNNYTNYFSLQCNGYSDAFIFKGMDLTRNPYDYYNRSGSACNLNFVGNCIEGGMNSTVQCSDTANLCLNGYITSNTHASTSSYYNTDQIGPLHQYIWNNNFNDSLSNLYVNSSGYNSVKVTTLDGCYSSRDTVYVKINPLPPPPLITDSYGANTLQPPLTNSIHICGPSTITLTGGNVQNTYLWYGNYISTHDSVALINATDTYTFEVTDFNGCSNRNWIKIIIDAPMTQFVPKQITDSISICKGIPGIIKIYDTISNPTGVYPYPCVNYTISGLIFSSPGLSISGANNCDLSIYANANTSGWYKYIYKYGFTSLCGTYTVTLNDSIYINVKAVPSGTIIITGNTSFCPGDSTIISVSSVSVSSSNVIYTITPGMSVWAHQTGNVNFNLDMIDTISGCTNADYKYIYVTQKPNPFIILNPYNSIICPNDSVKLTINLPGAINYEWHGPTGLLLINSQSFYSQTAGFYHCIVTDNNGCVFTTNTVEIKQYATPYLMSTPTNIICNNQPINLHVNTLDSTMIVWNTPLFGGGATKVITNPGVYSCQVTMCGITTTLSINIIGSNPTANITTFGSTTVCPFDSVLLTGNSGMTNYIWQPGNHLGQNYVVHAAGNYTLEVTDIYGCTAKSLPVTVAFTSTVLPPSAVVNDTICAGQTATLSATGNGTNQLEWFQNSNSGSVINTGTIYTTPTLSNQTTYYVASVAPGGCHSFGVPVTVFIYSTSLPPLLQSDTTVCIHDSLKIITPYINGASYNWTGPGISANTTNIIAIGNADITHSGIYSVTVSGFGCTAQSSSISIMVLNPLTPVVSGNDSICENSNYTAVVNPVNLNYTYEWQGPGNYSNVNDSLKIVNASINQSGTYTITSNLFGCLSTPATLQLTVLVIPPTPAIISNTPCVGDTLFLIAVPVTSYNYMWFNQNGTIGSGNTISIPSADTANSGYYGLMASNFFCNSSFAFDSVNVIPYPSMTLTADTIACDNSSITLVCSSNYQNYSWNTGSTNSSISVSQSGTYWVTTQNGNCIKTDSIHVSMVNCASFNINVFTPNGDGSNDVFMFRSPAIKEIHCQITNRWGEKMGEFNGPANGWAGKNMNNNRECEQGTYFYIAEIKTIEGIFKSITGFVTLMR